MLEKGTRLRDVVSFQGHHMLSLKRGVGGRCKFSGRAPTSAGVVPRDLFVIVVDTTKVCFGVWVQSGLGFIEGIRCVLPAPPRLHRTHGVRSERDEKYVWVDTVVDGRSLVLG